MEYTIVKESGITYSFNERMNLFNKLSSMITIVGSCLIDRQYQHIQVKPGYKMREVKSILRKHFLIDYRKEYYWNSRKDRGYYNHCAKDDIIKLCKIFLEHNHDLDYYSRFDPLMTRNKVSKVVYQYGALRYDLI